MFDDRQRPFDTTFVEADRWCGESASGGTVMSSEVDDWFAERQHPLTEAMQRARKLILEGDPRVTVSIKWKTPTFSYQGNIVSFNPSTKFVSLMFHRGAEIQGDFPHLWKVVTNDIDFSHNPVVRDHFP